MRKNYFKSAIMVVAVCIIATSCQSSKRAASTSEPTNAQKIQQMKEEAELIKAQQALDEAKADASRAETQRAANEAIAAKNAQKQAERLAEATEQPCQIYDDADWYTATATRRVHRSGINTAPTALLRTSQQLLLQKLKSSYKAVVRDYFDQMDMDEGSYAASHIESAGDRIINQKINETYEVCRKNTDFDEQGYCLVYMAIKISKKAVVDDIAKGLSNDKKMETRFNEEQFRKSAFKVFEQDQRESYRDYESNRGQE